MLPSLEHVHNNKTFDYIELPDHLKHLKFIDIVMGEFNVFMLAGISNPLFQMIRVYANRPC